MRPEKEVSTDCKKYFIKENRKIYFLHSNLAMDKREIGENEETKETA